MQPTFTSSRILLPVKPWFIALTLFLALMLNFLPTARWPGVPDWVMLVLCFWAVREPLRVGMGWGFMLGLLMDVADASLMGQHALAYVLFAYFANALSRRVLWFAVPLQALHLLPLFLFGQAVQLLVVFISSGNFVGLAELAGPLVAAVLWIPLTFLLLLPQYQPVERDDNRPI